MKYLPLIWAGLWRKPARTLLTFLSIVVAFLLFGMLQGVDSAFDRIVGQQKLDRMFVDPRFAQPVPYSYKAQIERVKGVTKITEVRFMGGYYQDMKNGLGVIFTIPSVWLAIRPEYQIPRAQVAATLRSPTAVVISDWLAEHNHWKVGDRITIKGGIPRKGGDNDWTFDVVGIMHNTEAVGEGRQILANYQYLDEGARERFGRREPLPHAHRRCRSRRAHRSRDRQQVRQLSGRDTHPVRAGPGSVGARADRRLQVLHARDHERGVLCADVPHAQHHHGDRCASGRRSWRRSKRSAFRTRACWGSCSPSR